MCKKWAVMETWVHESKRFKAIVSPTITVRFSLLRHGRKGSPSAMVDENAPHRGKKFTLLPLDFVSFLPFFTFVRKEKDCD